MVGRDLGRLNQKPPKPVEWGTLISQVKKKNKKKSLMFKKIFNVQENP